MGRNPCAEQASDKALPFCGECAREPPIWATGEPGRHQLP